MTFTGAIQVVPMGTIHIIQISDIIERNPADVIVLYSESLSPFEAVGAPGYAPDR